MEKAEIKEALHSYNALCRERGQISEKIRRLEASLGASAQGSDGMPHGSGISDPTARTAEALAELKAEYENMLPDIVQTCIQVERMIGSLEPTERTIARYRYIDGMTWEEVAVATGYSWRQVHRIHGRLLEHLTENMS